jgi:hypothetical protein
MHRQYKQALERKERVRPFERIFAALIFVPFMNVLRIQSGVGHRGEESKKGLVPLPQRSIQDASYISCTTKTAACLLTRTER